jgi:hypothetical protein
VNTFKKLKIIKREISPFISRYIKNIRQECEVKAVKKTQDPHVFGAFVSFVLLAVIGDFLELF